MKHVSIGSVVEGTER